MTNSATSTPPPRSPSRSSPNPSTSPKTLSGSPCVHSRSLPLSPLHIPLPPLPLPATYTTPSSYTSSTETDDASSYRKLNANSNGALKRKAEAVDSDADAESEDDDELHDIHKLHQPSSHSSLRSMPPSSKPPSSSSHTKNAVIKPAAVKKEDQIPRNEYQDGHIVCEGCKRQVPFRDDAPQGDGGFTVRLWENHLKTWYVFPRSLHLLYSILAILFPCCVAFSSVILLPLRLSSLLASPVSFHASHAPMPCHATDVFHVILGTRGVFREYHLAP